MRNYHTEPCAMNKTDLIQKIKLLDGISQDERSYLINLVNTKKKYGLVWEDKPEDAKEEMRTKLPVLKEVVERRITADPPQTSPEGREPKASQEAKPSAKNLQTSLFEPVNIDRSDSSSLPFGEGRGGAASPNHILIEGDNLHALTALTFTHEGKIDVIYIDPPYNTGNKDFKYNDSFVDREDSYRHSKWLSFMDKRLRITKRLLSEKGVIFISIDDNEQAQLKILCDEVFYEGNYLATFVWKRRASSAMANYLVSTDHEVVLCYKNTGLTSFKGIEKEFKGYKNPDKDPRGEWTTADLTVGMNKDLRPNQYYDLFDPVSKITFKANPNRVWAYIPSSMDKLISENRVIFPADINKRPMLKRFKNELKDSVNPTSTLLNSIENVKIGLNSEGTRLLQEVIDSNIFIYPKPLSLVKFLINQYPNSNCTILDFFAGSGTTLHATMQLNAEDGGNRQCILVTNNENNICEEVTWERNRRVIQGYTNSKGEWVKGLSNNNLRYYRSEFVPSMKTEPNKRLLTQCSTDLLCIKEDCYTDITESVGFNPASCRIYTNDKGKLTMVVYHNRKQSEVCEQLIAYIKTIDQLAEPIKLYAFSPEKETLLDDFWEVADKIEAVPLPEAIYNAYRATFKTLQLDKKPPVETTHALSPEINSLPDDNELFEPNPDEE
jgi:adenine-specific DNA-methyltransferase